MLYDSYGMNAFDGHGALVVGLGRCGDFDQKPVKSSRLRRHHPFRLARSEGT